MFVDISEESFRKYVSSIELNPYKESLTKLNRMKIEVMIEEGLLPYNDSFWAEMDNVASELRVLYAEKNKDAFIVSLDDIELNDDEINSLLKSKCFLPKEKEKILSKLNVATLGIETAKIIKELNFRIDRTYTNAAWSVLEEGDKYALLLNQIDTYKNEELPDLFAELDQVYHQLIERTRHKFKFAYTDYNKNLLSKLIQKDYITSAEEEWDDNKKPVIIGYVKQIKI